MTPANIIVDANIVFSAILNTQGKIGDLLINSREYFHFIAPEFFRTEIQKHHHKLVTLSGLTSAKIHEAQFHVSRDIIFISPQQIGEPELFEAEKLVAGVDPKDAIYIAYSKHFGCKLWSGDGKLTRGLWKKGYKEILTTQDLYSLRETLMQKN